MSNHWSSVGSVVMALVSFAMGSPEGGAVFILLAVWLEVSAALSMKKKYKLPAKPAVKPKATE